MMLGELKAIIKQVPCVIHIHPGYLCSRLWAVFAITVLAFGLLCYFGCDDSIVTNKDDVVNPNDGDEPEQVSTMPTPNDGDEPERVSTVPTPKQQTPWLPTQNPPPATMVTAVDPARGATVPSNQQFTLTFDQGVAAATIGGTAADGSGLNWTASPALSEGERVWLTVSWTNHDRSSGSMTIGPYTVFEPDQNNRVPAEPALSDWLNAPTDDARKLISDRAARCREGLEFARDTFCVNEGPIPDILVGHLANGDGLVIVGVAMHQAGGDIAIRDISLVKDGDIRILEKWEIVH